MRDIKKTISSMIKLDNYDPLLVFQVRYHIVMRAETQPCLKSIQREETKLASNSEESDHNA